jgi:alkylation response protein AidB-like acyl-CoA dehydrogenase
MDFHLSEEQEMIRDSLVGCYSQCNSDELLVQKYDRKPALDAELWRAQMELGLTGVMVPESLGGLGMDLLTLAVAAEVSGAYAVATPLEYQCLAAWAIAHSGSQTLIETWLQPIVLGGKVATLALSWEGAEGDPDRLSTHDGTTVSGVRRFVPFAAQADIAVLTLADGKLGLVELRHDSVVLEAVEPLDRSRPVCHLRLNDTPVEIVPEALAERLYDAVLVLHAASAFGAAKRCLDMSVEYAKVREQFGQPIGHFQALKHQLAHMALDTEPSRFLYWYAAHCWDIETDDARQMAALCKAHLSEVAVSTARAAVEAHGGIGFTWELPIHIWLKRAMADSAIYGTPARQRARSAELAGW